jgi:hypothetical protein
MRGTCHRCLFCRHKRAKILLEVVTLEVPAPLALALDGDATIFAFVMMVELGPEISHSEAGHKHTWCTWGMRSRRCTWC